MEEKHSKIYAWFTLNEQKFFKFKEKIPFSGLTKYALMWKNAKKVAYEYWEDNP